MKTRFSCVAGTLTVFILILGLVSIDIFGQQNLSAGAAAVDELVRDADEFVAQLEKTDLPWCGGGAAEVAVKGIVYILR